MDTKRIREALSAMRSCIKSGEGWSGDMEAAYDAAVKDLENAPGPIKTDQQLFDHIHELIDSPLEGQTAKSTLQQRLHKVFFEDK
jgi:hypothetical protein